MRKWFLFLSLIFLLFALWSTYQNLFVPEGAPVIMNNIVAFTPTKVTPKETMTVGEVEVTATETVPTAEPLVQKYLLFKKVDLSSGVPIQMVIYLPDNKVLPSTWAKPISWTEGESPDVFGPHKGTTYIYQGNDYDQGFGNVPIWLAHSGSIKGKELFAANLEYFLRIKEVGVSQYTVAESQELFASLMGSSVTVCQDETKKELTASSMDLTCYGSLVEMEVVGGQLILHEEVEEFMFHTLDMHDYLMRKYPDAGFERITANDGLLYVICLSRLADQPNDGTDKYTFNRAIFALKAVSDER